MTDFFRYPHTAHIAWLADARPREDKVLTQEEARELLRADVIVEEKLDGSNLGFSLEANGGLLQQNRGQFLTEPFVGQFSRLSDWLMNHQESLCDGLSPSLIVFGEWCAAKHSLTYDRLSDWWLLFDIYDRKTNRFWSTKRRNSWGKRFGFNTVPEMREGRLDLNGLREIVLNARSSYRDGPPEGIIIRQEDDEWLHARVKLVRPDFTQAISEHWRKRPIEWNRIAY